MYGRSQFGSDFETTETKLTACDNAMYLTEDGRQIFANGADIPLNVPIYLVTCRTIKGIFIVDWARADDPRLQM